MVFIAGTFIGNITQTQQFRDVDYVLIYDNVDAKLIRKDYFLATISGLTPENIEKLNRIIIDGDRTKVLRNDGTYGGINWNDVVENPIADQVPIVQKLSVSQDGHLMYDGAPVGSDGSTIEDWVSGQNYSSTDPVSFVIYNNSLYKCTTTHVSTAEFNPNNWQLIGADTYVLPIADLNNLGGIKPDQTSIIVDEITGVTSVPDGSTTVKGIFKIDGVTLALNADGQLEAIGSGGTSLGRWISGASYDVDNLVINETTIYICTSAHTSAATFAEDAGNWQALTGPKGDTGDSAYQTWLAQGNIGTEQEFLDSLNGTDGFSPTVSTTIIGGGHTLSVTDANGTKSFNVMDGITTVTTTAVDINATALASGWSANVPYEQTIQVNGLTADSRPVVDIVPSVDIETRKEEARQWSYIDWAVADNNTITLICDYYTPTIDLNFQVKVV